MINVKPCRGQEGRKKGRKGRGRRRERESEEEEEEEEKENEEEEKEEKRVGKKAALKTGGRLKRQKIKWKIDKNIRTCLESPGGKKAREKKVERKREGGREEKRKGEREGEKRGGREHYTHFPLLL